MEEYDEKFKQFAKAEINNVVEKFESSGFDTLAFQHKNDEVYQKIRGHASPNRIVIDEHFSIFQKAFGGVEAVTGQ